jgi:hypothetical protein
MEGARCNIHGKRISLELWEETIDCALYTRTLCPQKQLPTRPINFFLILSQVSLTYASSGPLRKSMCRKRKEESFILKALPALSSHTAPPQKHSAFGIHS